MDASARGRREFEMLRSLKDLHNYTIRASGDDIGKLKDIYFDDHHWLVRYVIVDTGGWLQERKVLVSPVALTDSDWASRRFDVDLTREQIETSPRIDQDMPVSRQKEAELVKYYRWPTYWGAHVMHPSQPPIPAPTGVTGEQRPSAAADEAAVSTIQDGDPALRSLREVIGYHIQAADGSIGHVEDMIADDETWKIRYLVIDTRNWLPGKKVLVAPGWVEKFDWNETKVFVELTRDAIKESPEFDPSAPLNRKQEERLYDFYGRPYYWS
jgi:sporulation protein YlmC with PRC-barrel domain